MHSRRHRRWPGKEHPAAVSLRAFLETVAATAAIELAIHGLRKEFTK
jgi:hypothetical protein